MRAESMGRTRKGRPKGETYNRSGLPAANREADNQVTRGIAPTSVEKIPIRSPRRTHVSHSGAELAFPPTRAAASGSRPRASRLSFKQGLERSAEELSPPQSSAHWPGRIQPKL